MLPWQGDLLDIQEALKSLASKTVRRSHYSDIRSTSHEQLRMHRKYFTNFSMQDTVLCHCYDVYL